MFEGEDYWVEDSHIIESEAVETAVLSMLDGKPMYTCFDPQTKSVTAIKADVQALSLEYEMQKALLELETQQSVTESIATDIETEDAAVSNETE